MSEIINSVPIHEKYLQMLMKILAKRSDVCNIEISSILPADNNKILQWEEKYQVRMSEDIKCFYLMSNGIHITWSVLMNAQKIGKLFINSIENLNTIEIFNIEENHHLLSDTNNPQFNTEWNFFKLDSCCEYAKICLVYNKNPSNDKNGSVWLLDRSLNLYFLAKSFTAYYRLMIAHMGIAYWQYLFTHEGAPSQTNQWLNLFCPQRLKIYDTITDFENCQENSNNAIEIEGIFKDLQLKFKEGQTVNKKKPGLTK